MDASDVSGRTSIFENLYTSKVLPISEISDIFVFKLFDRYMVMVISEKLM